MSGTDYSVSSKVALPHGVGIRDASHGMGLLEGRSVDNLSRVGRDLHWRPVSKSCRNNGGAKV